MSEEKNIPKQLKTNFVGDEDLPVHFVNIANIRAGTEEFYFTLGTVLPLEISDLKELEDIDSVKVRALVRFVLTRNVMKQFIDTMQTVYDQQTKQSEMRDNFQEKGKEHDDDDRLSSRNL
jgi:hypothetical protein